MSEQPGSDLVSSSSRWGTTRDEHAVRHFQEDELLEIIETTLINDLPQQLIGRLREIFLESRHVDIINIEHHFLATQRPDLSSSFFGKFILIKENIQNILSIGLC